MTQPIGAFTFVLHSHIPYVLDHGITPHGTDWLAEAAAETYLPLLNACNRLVEEGISPKITLGLTPVLVEQLADEDFKAQFEGYLTQRIEMAKADLAEFEKAGSYHMAYLARYWGDWYGQGLADFQGRYDRNLVAAFKALQDNGHIEIITSSATHGYSPLLSQDTTLQAQVKIGVESYQRHFGRRPRGYWLPECAYRPRYVWSEPSLVPGAKDKPPILRKGVEEFLAEQGIAYFFADSHLLKGKQMGTGVYADRFDALAQLWSQFENQYVPEKEAFSPYYSYVVNSSGKELPKVSVFARDPATGIQVWSGQHGYPGDEWYLEFHKKHVSAGSKALGLRYWRISQEKENLGAKGLYEPHRASERIQSHADHFCSLVRSVLKDQAPAGDGIICSTYDTELFGHWWFEGPQFLYAVIKQLAGMKDLTRQTCSEYLDQHPAQNVPVALPEGSWGEGGFHWIWLNQETAWAWELVYQAEETMQRLAQSHGDNPKLQGLLKQAARELLLLSASDWPFCISTGGAKDYAAVRIKVHFDNFEALAGLIERVGRGQELGIGDWKNVAECEERDRLFSEIPLSAFARLDQSA
jgi:1,4-alpha-glucan branching enzyme